MDRTTDTKTSYRLGDLLVLFGFAGENDLVEMLSIANETSMPVGRVFVLTGVISENDLNNLIFCQSFLKEKLLDIDMAMKAMQLTRQKNLPFEEALTSIGWSPTDLTLETTPLGELLFGANFISRNQLESALAQQRKSGLPFGRTLVLSGIISESLLAAAVNAQIMVRDQKITREQAVDALKEARRRQISFETSLEAKGFYDLPKRTAPRLGELLTYAGLISDSELVSALETGLISRQPVGEVLVSLKLLTREILDAALASQKLLASGSIKFNDIRTILDHVKDGKSFEWAVNSLTDGVVKPAKAPQASLYAFLKMLRCIDDAEVAQAFESAKNNAQIISQILLLGGVLDEGTLQKAEECRNLVYEGRLSFEHATIAFDYSRRRSITMSEALQELQWHEAKDVQDKDQNNGGAPQAPPVNLGAMQQVALELSSRGDYGGSRDVWNEILGHLHPPYDARYCECLEGIAATHTLEQNFTMARRYYQMALDSRKQIHGPDSLSTAFAVNNIGRIAYFEQAYPEAENHGREYIRIIAQNMGSDHPDVACGYQNLATVYHVQNKYSAAENAYKIAVKICANKLGDTHPTTTRIARNYASLLQKMDRMAEAQNMDPLACGTISGSWRALEMREDDKLHGNGQS